MENNKSIQIEQVGNGFVVSPSSQRPHQAVLFEDTIVCQSMAELQIVVKGHFSFRNKKQIESDE